jgi:hypothetical protein
MVKKRLSKRKLPPHIVLPDGRWRFVKKGRAKTPTVKRSATMARRRRSYRVRSRRSGSRGFGGIKSMLIPVAAGAADAYINPMLPINGVGSTAIGILGHNTTIRDIGLWQVGASVANMVGNPLGGETGVWL